MLNMDFTKRVVINTEDQPWVASPKNGVWRKPLAREGQEHGHATSIVRYDPGSSFSHHDHPLGEEIFVIEGIFSDESGNYSAGTYFRNPEGFSHAPFSEKGCVILVKLHQFQPADNHHVCTDTHSAKWQSGPDGLESLPLHMFGAESVSLLRAPPGVPVNTETDERGEEIFVIRGQLHHDQGTYPAGTWIRNPPGSSQRLIADQQTLLWIKSGHLN